MPVSDFNESTVFSDVGNFTEQTCVLWVAACNTEPWIFTKLFDAEGNTVLVLIELKNLGCDFLTLFQELRSDDVRVSRPSR